MKAPLRRALALLAALASTAMSAENGIRCPDGGKPKFTGHPFIPYDCPEPGKEGAAPAAAAVDLSSAALPGLKDRRRNTLKPLIGRWTGMAVYGPERYEIECDIEKKGGGYLVRLETVNYRIRNKSTFTVELKGSFWSPGELAGEVRLDQIPGSRLEISAWLGASSAGEPALDRELAAVYKGRPDTHRLRFSLEGKDALRYAYTFTDGAGLVGQAVGELSRSGPQRR